MNFFDRIPLAAFVVLALFLAAMPFNNPHLLEKIRMLWAGELNRGIDIFDLFWHSLGLILLAMKLVRHAIKKP